ncbi:Potassium-transporting ATPase ATP-binding subunit [Bosea thiooxidans]
MTTLAATEMLAADVLSRDILRGRAKEQTMSSPHSDHGHHGHPGHEGHPASGHSGHDRHDNPKVVMAAGSSHAEHAGHGGHDHGAMVADFRRRFWVTLILTPPVLLLSPMIQHWLGIASALAFPGDGYVLFALSTAAYLYGGWPFLTGFVSELRKGQPGMMTLIALAISAAYFFSAAVTFGFPGEAFYWELVTLILIMLLGHWVEMRSVMGASRALEELVRLLPDSATRIEADGSTREVPISALKPGDRVIVRPGAKVPVDGKILEGSSGFNEAMLTGESRPVTKTVGATAIGGAINGANAVTIEVTATGDSTYLAQVIDLVKKAQATRSRTQDIANRAAAWLTYIALIVGFGTLFVWWLVLSAPLEFALERMVTVMVVACPHALGLAVPLVVAVSTSLSASNGLLIRDRAAFERARNLDAAVFDKTGTLTEGRFGVSDIVLLGKGKVEEELAFAAAAESQSEHPIAHGIVAEAKARNIALPKATEVSNITGEGLVAKVANHAARGPASRRLDRGGSPLAPRHRPGRGKRAMGLGDCRASTRSLDGSSQGEAWGSQRRCRCARPVRMAGASTRPRRRYRLVRPHPDRGGAQAPAARISQARHCGRPSHLRRELLRPPACSIRKDRLRGRSRAREQCHRSCLADRRRVVGRGKYSGTTRAAAQAARAARRG